MTLPNTTPEGFRTAAYLATKARLDAARSRTGKTSRQVTCTPPNVKCGGRCIPPNWDCRLRGQGADPQLRAVQTDPVGGLANIERGVKRIGKGLRTGSFSEIEGGKRAIVRGVVKAVPGDIQKKKELGAKLERQGARIAFGLAAVGAGLGVHNLLMKRNTLGYRDGVGADINNAVRIGVNKVLDSIPIVRGERARIRSRAQAGIAAAVSRQRNPVSAELTNQLAKTGVSPEDEASGSNLVLALQRVNNDPKFRTSEDFDAWNREHTRAFWGVTKLEEGVGLPKGENRASIFARPATNEFIARQFNLSGEDTLSTGAIKDAVSLKLKDYKEDLVNLAQVSGFKVNNLSGGGRGIDKDDRRAFIKSLVSSTLPARASNRTERAALDAHLTAVLTKSPDTLRDEIYNKTFAGFNQFYRDKASSIKAATEEAYLSTEMRGKGTGQTLLDATQARAAFISGTTIRGSNHAEIVLRQYYAQNVRPGTRNLFTITDRLAIGAASEIAGRRVNTEEAFRLLSTEYGFSGVVPVRSSAVAPRARRSVQQRIGDRARQLRAAALARGEELSLEAAYRAARAEVTRGDSLPIGLVRAATYFAVRADLQGKPCGASHIPKSHNCTKGAGSTDKSTKESEQDKQSKSTRNKVLAVAAGVGTAAVTAKLLSDPKVKAKINNFGESVTKSAKEAQYKARQEALTRSIDGLSSKNLREGLDKLPAPYKTQAYNLLGKAKLAAAAMSLEMAGYEPVKVDATKNYSSFKNKQGDIKSIGSVGDNLVSYTFHEVQGDAKNILPKGRQSKHVVFQIDRKFDQKTGVSTEDTKKIRSMLTSMFNDSVSKVEDGTLLLNTAWDKDGKGSGRAALYRRYGFNNVDGIDGMQWAVVENGAVKRIPKGNAMSEFMAILQSNKS